MTTRRLLAHIALAAFLPVVALGACSDDAKDTANDVKENVKDEAGQAGARAAAEAFRAAVATDDVAGEKGASAISVIEENAKDLPGDPELGGAEDGDGDGLDDDGKVTLTVGDAPACVTLPKTGNDEADIEVTDGAC